MDPRLIMKFTFSYIHTLIHIHSLHRFTQYFLVHLHFDCNLSHEVRCTTSFCGFTLVLKFWIWKHFGLGMLNLYCICIHQLLIFTHLKLLPTTLDFSKMKLIQINLILLTISQNTFGIVKKCNSNFILVLLM